ncbi:MAG: hypothetical protein Q9222_002609 [Ikaeria aurantiellina]
MAAAAVDEGAGRRSAEAREGSPYYGPPGTTPPGYRMQQAEQSRLHEEQQQQQHQQQQSGEATRFSERASEDRFSGSDPSPTSTTSDRPRPGTYPVRFDVGILEDNPDEVMPTIEEGRDPLLALQEQRDDYQRSDRRLRQRLIEGDDRIRQLEETVEALTRRADEDTDQLRTQAEEIQELNDMVTEHRERIQQLVETVETLRGDGKFTASLNTQERVGRGYHTDCYKVQHGDLLLTQETHERNRLTQQTQDQAQEIQARDQRLQSRDREIAALQANNVVPQQPARPQPARRRAQPALPQRKKLPRKCKDKVTSYKI